MLQTEGTTDFRGRVADFYRGRGYQVRENCKVRGASERVYAIEMVAQGPLGNLLVSFGDAGGIDAMEIARVRTLSKDIGATPVIASPWLDIEMRQLAAQMAVVIVDQDALDAPETKIPTIATMRRRDHDEQFAEHPWPTSGRAQADNLPVDPVEDSFVPVQDAAPAQAVATPPPASWPSGSTLRDLGAESKPAGKFGWLEKAVAKAAPEAVAATPPAKPTVAPQPTAIDARLGMQIDVVGAAQHLAVPAAKAHEMESPFILRDVKPKPVANAVPRSHADEILASLDDENRTYASSLSAREVAAPAPLPKADIEVDTTVLARRASPVERVRSLGDNKLLYAVLGFLAAATALYIGLLVSR